MTILLIIISAKFKWNGGGPSGEILRLSLCPLISQYSGYKQFSKLQLSFQTEQRLCSGDQRPLGRKCNIACFDPFDDLIITAGIVQLQLVLEIKSCKSIVVDG